MTNVGAPRFDPEFERAFVAVRYFLGARGGDLGAPLGEGAPEAAATSKRLANTDRQRRAEALAVEVGRVVRALELGCYR